MTALLAALLAATAPAPPVEAVTDVVAARAAHLGLHRVSRERAQRIAAAVLEAAGRHRLRPAVLLAVIEVESAYGALEESTARCVGLMQLNPRTAPAVARRLGLRYYHLGRVEHSVALGAAYLRELLDRYGRLDHALSAYNRGPGRFERQGRPVGTYARRALRKLPVLEAALRA